MDIPSFRWYPAIACRRSRRLYNPLKRIPDPILTELQSVCTQFKPFSHVRTELVTSGCDRVFKGIIGSYGKIKCAQAFIAFIGDMTDEHIQEKVGFVGEGVVLEATSLQLATCWVAGFFKPKVVSTLIQLSEKERVLTVSPVGYADELESLEERFMTGFGRSHKRNALLKLTTGLKENKWPDWIKISLEAARLAPSAINRQPWNFKVEPNAITVSVRKNIPDFNVSKRLDCGIAMLHIEAASIAAGVIGEWEFLDNPLVARYTVVTGNRAD